MTCSLEASLCRARQPKGNEQGNHETHEKHEKNRTVTVSRPKAASTQNAETIEFVKSIPMSRGTQWGTNRAFGFRFSATFVLFVYFVVQPFFSSLEVCRQGVQIRTNEAYLPYAAMTEDAAQRSIRTFYEYVKFFPSTG